MFRPALKRLTNAWSLDVAAVSGSQRSTSTAAPSDRPQVRPHTEIPGFKVRPIVQSTLDFVLRKDFDKKRQHITFTNMVNEFGPIFTIHFMGLRPMVIISDPDDCEAFHRSNLQQPARDAFQSLRKIRHEDPFFNKQGGMLAENYDEWWRVRKRVQTPIARPGNEIRYLPGLDQVTLEFMDIIDNLQRKHGEMPEDFIQELYKFSFEAISLVVLNVRLGCLSRDLKADSAAMKLIESANNILGGLAELEFGMQWWRLFPTTTYRKMRTAHQQFVDLTLSQIHKAEERMKNSTPIQGEPLPLLETFLKTPGLSVQDVITTSLDLLLAGIDTTSHTVAFTMYDIAKHPEVQKKLHAEVDSALGDGSETITQKHLKKLPYLKACVKESLRLNPIVFGTVRILQEDLVMSGYLVPKGWQALSLNMIMNKDERNFKRAKEYVPERWARDRPLGRIHPFCAMPFNFGKRMCVGRHIAEQEIYVFLARLLHRFRVEYKHKDMGYVTSFVGTPSEPLKFEFHPRRENK